MKYSKINEVKKEIMRNFFIVFNSPNYSKKCVICFNTWESMDKSEKMEGLNFLNCLNNHKNITCLNCYNDMLGNGETGKPCPLCRTNYKIYGLYKLLKD